MSIIWKDGKPYDTLWDMYVEDFEEDEYMGLIRILDTDDLAVDYDKTDNKYRVSFFRDYHFVDEVWFDAYKAKEMDCSYCNNGTHRKPVCQFDGTLIRYVNFCDECGRDLRKL